MSIQHVLLYSKLTVRGQEADLEHCDKVITSFGLTPGITSDFQSL